jgi:hypothetical protein
MRYYLACWDEQGLESLTDITEYEHQRLADKLYELVGQEPPRNPLGCLLYAIRLRARFNGHRAYEAYAFKSDLSSEQITSMFEDNPQLVVDFLRQKGVKICSNGPRLEVRIR